MKIKILISLLLISTSSFSNEIDCDQEDNLSKLANGITYPNCNIPANIIDFKNHRKNLLCNSCKPSFEMIHGSKIVENKNHLQEEFFNSAFKEYKKNLSNNLLNVLKTRSIPSTNSDLNKSISSCRMKTQNDFANGCSSASAKKLLQNSEFFANISRELANDAAIFVASDANFSPKPTILSRSKQLCHIPEKDVILFSSATYEESISPEMIEYFKKLDPKKYSSMFDILNSDDFVETFGDPSDLKVSLGNHPLLSPHTNSPSDFINFMKKVPAPSATKDLRALLYSKPNGDNFDKVMAESCDKSFKALKESLCSNEFENGQLFIDPTENFAKFEISNKLPIEDALASSESLIDNNIKLLELCENQNGNGKKNLTEINKAIGSSVQEDQKKMPLELFQTAKHNAEIGTLTSSLCEMTEKNCIQGTLTCSIYRKYQAFKTPGSPSKPSEFANKGVNELLRVMIGDSPKIEPDTRRILIAEGILPKEDGKLVEKPQFPDSPQEFFAKVPAQKINPLPGKSGSNPASNQTARAQSTSNNYSNNSVSNNSTPSAPAGNMDDISDLVRGSTEDIKDIQDEIKRRLGNLPQSKPATIEDAKKIARDTFKNKGRKITPYQEQALADRMLQPAVPNSVSASTPNTANPNSPSVSDTESQSEKWRNGLKDKALMGMQGAQQVLANDASTGRGPASVGDKPKDLTKVALNIAEDPKVKLSDIFANKIDQNDPETQLLKVLLKSKNNFLLQIKDMNFKVVFDGNNFNVLLESGDRAEAERMRPQLEIFLKRLKT